MNSTAPIAQAVASAGPLARLDRWLHVLPHPAPVVQISPAFVAAARWEGPRLETHAVEPLEAGAVMPSPVEGNITQPEGVRTALQQVFSRLGNLAGPVALLVPDPVVRVFILPFETFPRKESEALPLLRWRLKKSVPFDVEETSVSWSRQTARDGSLEIVAAVARQKIVHEYEELVQGLGATPTVVLSATLATLPLLGEHGSTLLMRMSDRNLTTAIVRGTTLVLYRSSEMPAAAAQLDPKWMLEEIFPAAAYYQDTWGETIDRALLAGFHTRQEVFQAALEQDVKIPVRPLAAGEGVSGLDRSALDLLQRGLEPLAGWMANEGA